jgi:DNA-binding CsgD family transcriptional regulator
MTFGSCDHLTERERDVLFCLADGESNRQIARSLDIAPATARAHTRNVLSKLGVQSRVLAIASARPVQVPALEGSPISSLTRREREVLGCMVEGLTRAAIAARLKVSPNTARTHVRNILAKLGVHSTPEAVALVSKTGYSSDAMRSTPQ